MMTAMARKPAHPGQVPHIVTQRIRRVRSIYAQAESSQPLAGSCSDKRHESQGWSQREGFGAAVTSTRSSISVRDHCGTLEDGDSTSAWVLASMTSRGGSASIRYSNS